MSGILRAELKKIVGKKYIWIILAVLTAFWIYRVGYQNSKVAAYFDPPIVRNYLISQSGPLTEEKYNQIQRYYNIIEGEGGDSQEQGDVTLTSDPEADDQIIMQLKGKADYIVAQDKNRVAVINQAKRNLKRYRQSGNDYEIAKNEKIINMYSDSHELILTPNTSGWNFYFEENSHALLLIIFLIIALAPIFSSENESHMQSIIYPTAAGRGKTAAAKLLSVVLISGAAAAFFEIVNFLCYFCNYYMKNFGLPIQNLSIFEASPFTLNLGQYTLIKLGLFILFGIVTGLVTAFFSKLFSRTVLALIADLVIIGGAYGITYFFVAPSYIVSNYTPEQLNLKSGLIKWFIPFITNPDIYFSEFNAVNIFGAPVLIHNIIIAIGVLFCILLIAATYLLYVKNISFKRKSGGRI